MISHAVRDARTSADEDVEREEQLADELADGRLDPNEVPPTLEPWDEGADDEAE